MILGLNSVIFLTFYFKIPKGIRRLYFVFTLVPIFVYSGIGLSYKEIDNQFVLHYLLYTTILMFTMHQVLRKKKSIRKPNHKLNKLIGLDKNSQRIFLYTGTTLFYLTFVVFLIVPEMRLWQIFAPPLPTVLNGYERIIFGQSNAILDLAQMFRIMLLPVFMIFLFTLVKNGRKINAVFFVLIWIYLEYLSISYIGRSELLIYLLFIFFVLVISPNFKINIKARHYLFISILFILLVPLLVAYQYVRVDKMVLDLGFIDSIKELFFYETDFPKYYKMISAMNGQITPLNYFLFFVLLPIPSILFKAKGSLVLSANKVFTTNILGLNYGARGYSGLLPSIFGEGVLIFGEYFYFIHAIIIGLFVSYLCKVLENEENLSILNVYFAVSCISIARGGSQGFIGTVINSLYVYFLFTFFIKQYIRKNRRG